MEFKDIDDLLSKINKVFAYYHNVDFGKTESELLKQAKERKALLYLKDDLGLIKELFYSTEKVTYTLTLKGNEVIKEGGWKKYSEKEKNKKRNKKTREIVAFWFNIIVPIIAIYVAYLAIKSDNRRIEEDILNKVSQQQKEIIEMEIDNRIESLTKRMDSVLLNIEHKPSLETE